MTKSVNLIGQQFGKLIVTERTDKRAKDGTVIWVCRCECGNSKHLNTKYLKRSTSCGCLLPRKHGMAHTRLYSIWENMKGRCLNPKHDTFEYYGGKGVELFEGWKDFINFKDWALNTGYSDELTIDRINVKGHYEPSNCRWVTFKTQMRNQTRTIFITKNGITKPLTQWCEEKGLKPSTVHERIRKGFPEELLLLPPWELKKPEYKNLKRYEKTRNDYKNTCLEMEEDAYATN